MMLVVTIILMIIIAFLAVFYSQNVTPEARVSAAYSSLNAVKEACKAAVQFVDVGQEDEYFFFGKTMTDAQRSEYAPQCGVSSFSGDRVYLIDPYSDKEEDRRRIKNLELSNLRERYVVDLDSDCYYLVGGIGRTDDESEKKYEYFDIQSLYDMIKKYGKV